MLEERVDEKTTVQLVFFGQEESLLTCAKADGTEKSRHCLLVAVIFIAGEVIEAKGWPTIEERGDEKTALQGAFFWVGRIYFDVHQHQRHCNQ